MTVLFLSMPAVLREVTDKDRVGEYMPQALYYLNCPSEEAFSTLLSAVHAGEISQEACLQLMTLLQDAERDGRALWPPPYGNNTFRELNLLLGGNCFETVDESGIAPYSPPEAQDRIAVTNPGIRAMY